MDSSFWVGLTAGAAVGAGLLYTLQQGAWKATVLPGTTSQTTPDDVQGWRSYLDANQQRVPTFVPPLAGPPDISPVKAPFTAQGNADADFELEDEVLGEHFTRNVQFFGRPGQERIMGAFVIVVGLGVRFPASYVVACIQWSCINLDAASCHFLDTEHLCLVIFSEKETALVPGLTLAPCCLHLSACRLLDSSASHGHSCCAPDYLHGS